MSLCHHPVADYSSAASISASFERIWTYMTHVHNRITQRIGEQRARDKYRTGFWPLRCIDQRLVSCMLLSLIERRVNRLVPVLRV